MELKIDLTYLRNISAGDNNLIKEMLEVFIEQVPEFTKNLEEAIKNKDIKVIAAIAHKAKSSAQIVGLNGLAESLKNLEHDALNNLKQNEYFYYLNNFKTTTTEAITKFKQIINNL